MHRVKIFQLFVLISCTSHNLTAMIPSTLQVALGCSSSPLRVLRNLDLFDLCAGHKTHAGIHYVVVGHYLFNDFHLPRTTFHKQTKQYRPMQFKLGRYVRLHVGGIVAHMRQSCCPRWGNIICLRWGPSWLTSGPVVSQGPNVSK